MGSFLGGSTPAAPTVTQQTNPTQQAQLPYYKEGLEKLAGLQDSFAGVQPYSYYPGQTLADFNPAMAGGYQGMINTGYGQGFPTVDAATQAFLTGVGGGYGSSNNPATPLFTSIAGDSSAGNWVPQGAIQGLYDTVGWAAQPNVGTSELTDVAQGKYLGPNQYLGAAIQAAFDPTERAFQTSVWPGINMNAEGAGRYGSGVMSNQRDQAQQAGYSGAGGMGLQSGQLLDQINRTKELAAQGLSSGFTQGGQLTNQALQLLPQILSGQLSPDQAILQGGSGLTALDQQQITDQMNRYYGNINAGWDTINAYMNAIGSPITVGGTTSQTNYQNIPAQILG